MSRCSVRRPHRPEATSLRLPWRRPGSPGTTATNASTRNRPSRTRSLVSGGQRVSRHLLDLSRRSESGFAPGRLGRGQVGYAALNGRAGRPVAPFGGPSRPFRPGGMGMVGRSLAPPYRGQAISHQPSPTWCRLLPFGGASTKHGPGSRRLAGRSAAERRTARRVPGGGADVPSGEPSSPQSGACGGSGRARQEGAGPRSWPRCVRAGVARRATC